MKLFTRPENSHVSSGQPPPEHWTLHPTAAQGRSCPGLRCVAWSGILFFCIVARGGKGKHAVQGTIPKQFLVLFHPSVYTEVVSCWVNWVAFSLSTVVYSLPWRKCFDRGYVRREERKSRRWNSARRRRRRRGQRLHIEVILIEAEL